MPTYSVTRYASLHDAVTAMMSHDVDVFAIDLDCFEKILQIEFYSYNDLLNLSLGHTLVFIGLTKEDDFKF